MTFPGKIIDPAMHACLATQHGLGYGGFSCLMEWFSSPEAVYEAPEEALRMAIPRMKPETLASLRHGPDLKAWKRVEKTCSDSGIEVLMPGRPGYPAPLLAITAPPPLLFARGKWLPGDARAVALVGTRGPTPYGRETAFALAKDLGRRGITVVSGLALGIDAAAHAGALDGGGRTAAVVGCGLDVDYPQAHRSLRERIFRGGVLLSEFPPGEPPRQQNFPRRNRVLSALARAVVVVEAGARSGALITAAYGRAQNKALFAVPGPIFSPVSVGTHALLREGARMALGAEDIAAAVDSRPPSSLHATEAPAPMPPTPRFEEDDPVLALWRDEETCALDSLSERARSAGLWPPERALSSLLPRLLRLEMNGQVQRLPGPVFRKVSASLARA